MAFRLRRRVRRPDPPVKIVMGDALMEELAERIEQRLIERARPETLACDNCFAICDATHPVMIGEGAKLGAVHHCDPETVARGDLNGTWIEVDVALMRCVQRLAYAEEAAGISEPPARASWPEQ